MKLNAKNPKPKDKEFTKYWETLLPEVTQRTNVSNSHLMQLSILCDCHTQYDELLILVKEQGHTVVKFSANGEQVMANPNLTQLNRVISQIKDYSRMLGLLLVKDEGANNEPEEDWG